MQVLTQICEEHFCKLISMMQKHSEKKTKTKQQRFTELDITAESYEKGGESGESF